MNVQHSTPTPEQIAWAAGLFEGEGCMAAYPRGKRGSGAQMSLCMTDEDVVRRFAAIIGSGNLHRPRIDRWPRDNQGHKPVHTWALYEAEQVVRVIELLLPYFGERRTARARQVLTIARDIGLHKGKRTRCPQGHLYAGDNLMLESITRNGVEYKARRCRTCRRAQDRRRKAALKRKGKLI